jgi:hypothetical protein
MSNEKYCYQLNELERADARTSGVYRIGWGDNADLWINNNFGFRK